MGTKYLKFWSFVCRTHPEPLNVGAGEVFPIGVYFQASKCSQSEFLCPPLFNTIATDIMVVLQMSYKLGYTHVKNWDMLDALLGTWFIVMFKFLYLYLGSQCLHDYSRKELFTWLPELKDVSGGPSGIRSVFVLVGVVSCQYLLIYSLQHWRWLMLWCAGPLGP